jgi:hypothetical protein
MATSISVSLFVVTATFPVGHRIIASRERYWIAAIGVRAAEKLATRLP